MKRVIYYLSIISILSACQDDEIRNYNQKLLEFEEEWRTCYDSKFIFPEELFIQGNEYIKCTIDSNEVLINNNSSGFLGTTRHVFTWVTADPNTNISNLDSATNALLITFFNAADFKHIALAINYQSDSVNSDIQKLLSNPIIDCATNFHDRDAYFLVSTHCDNNDQVYFSSKFSNRVSQQINIDNFVFNNVAGIWYYHLEYSFPELEVSNINWNDSTKVDMFGRPRSSNYLIEDIQITNMKCVIEFELPED